MKYAAAVMALGFAVVLTGWIVDWLMGYDKEGEAFLWRDEPPH